MKKMFEAQLYQLGKSKMPQISVIVPCYNVEPYLADCLESVLKQSFQDFEIICIEDCSTDNTKKILQNYQNNPKIKIIYNQQNKGLAISRNIGLDIACGQYIYFLDSDDSITNDCLETLYQQITQNKSDLAVGGTKVYSDDKNNTECVNQCKKMDNWFNIEELKSQKITPENISTYSQKINCTACNKLFSHVFLQKNELYFINDRCYHEDNGFWLKVLACCPTISCCKKETYLYRIRPESITSKTSTPPRKHLLDLKKSLSDALDYSKKHHYTKCGKFIKTEIYLLDNHSFVEWVWSDNQKKFALFRISIFNLKKSYRKKKLVLKIFGITIYSRKIK